MQCSTHHGILKINVIHNSIRMKEENHMITYPMQIKHLTKLNTLSWESVQLCDPMDCSGPVSSVHGVLQARILEWVAIPFSKGHPNPRIEPGSPALQADSLLSEAPGKPPNTCKKSRRKLPQLKKSHT